MGNLLKTFEAYPECNLFIHAEFYTDLGDGADALMGASTNGCKPKGIYFSTIKGQQLWLTASTQTIGACNGKERFRFLFIFTNIIKMVL